MSAIVVVLTCQEVNRGCGWETPRTCRSPEGRTRLTGIGCGDTEAKVITFVVCGYRVCLGLNCSLGDVRAGRSATATGGRRPVDDWRLKESGLVLQRSNVM